MRLPACVPLLIAGGRGLSIVGRETCEMAVMSVARTEAIGAVTSAVIATNGVTTGVIVATVTKGVTSAVIVVMTVVASAVTTAVKIVFVRRRGH